MVWWDGEISLPFSDLSCIFPLVNLPIEKNLQQLWLFHEKILGFHCLDDIGKYENFTSVFHELSAMTIFAFNDNFAREHMHCNKI